MSAALVYLMVNTGNGMRNWWRGPASTYYRNPRWVESHAEGRAWVVVEADNADAARECVERWAHGHYSVPAFGRVLAKGGAR